MLLLTASLLTTAGAGVAAGSVAVEVTASSPDRHSALEAAKRGGSPVEIWSLRTEESTTYANPDGSLRTELFSGPVRIKDKGVWGDIDTSLVESGGVLRPQRAKADLEISTGGNGAVARLSRGKGRSFGVRWAKALPRPTVAGNVATYSGVVPGGDLVVTALPTGMANDVVLRERPTRPLEIRLPLALSGLNFGKDASGRLKLTDASAGGLIASAPQPYMWDAAAQESPDSGRRAAVTTAVEKGEDGPVLVLKPDPAFLADPAVRYPVTVDPWTTLALKTDTFISTDYPTAQNAATWLHAGKFGSGGKTARTYLQFGTTRLAGSTINNADLRLWNYKSNDCGTSVGSGIQVRRVTGAWSPSALQLTAQPTTTGTNAVTLARAAGDPSCAEAEMYYSIEGIVQDWADGAANYGLQLRAANENDATNWRMYRSSENGDPAKGPKLIVDYTPPTRPDGTIPESAVTGVAAIDGQPVPGADVVATAWPREEILDGLADGAKVPTQAIGVAKADSQGRFIIDVDPDALPADYVADDGSVDVQLAIADATREVRWNYTATRPVGAVATAMTALADVVVPLWSTAPADVSENSGPATLSVDLGSSPRVAENRADSPAAWIDPGPEGEEIDPDTEVQPDPDPETEPEWQDDSLGVDAGARASAVAVEDRSDVFTMAAAQYGMAAASAARLCFTEARARHSGLQERFMEAHGWSGAKAKVTQQYGVDHQLGMGFKDTAGRWSAGGSRKVDLTASAERGGLTSVWVYNKVNYRDYTHVCTSVTTVIGPTERRPTGVHSLLTKFTKAKPVIFKDTRKCTTYTGGTYTKTRGKNATVSGGVDLGVVNVSAQSGFNSSSSISWTVTKKTRLCGNTIDGWADPTSRIAEAHKY
ncbi:DNRLRE domain-containing protein [Sphaerisporangium sp. NPDC005288]|uniref:DNRLRE domain-containing protein n=1 Tax=Sphaerisporangium sp. NPDC005288 TaxID=3155114 RepID=UPI0033BA2592